MAKPRHRNQTAPERLILDSGAVISLSRNEPRARAVLQAAWEVGVEVTMPSVVVAETVRGRARDTPVNRAINAVGEVTSVDERIGRLAGALLGATGSGSTIDAVVVASAIDAGGGVILTGDPDDLRALAEGHPEIVVQAL